MSKLRHSQKRVLRTTNCSASNAGKLESENPFSSQKKSKLFFHSFSAEILMKGVEQLKYHTRKQVNVYRAMSNTKFFSKKVVFEIQFDEDGYTFRDSTEHLMPVNWNHIWKQVSFYCSTKKEDNFRTGCASAKKKTQHMIYNPENPFWEKSNVSVTLLKSIKFSEKDDLPNIDIVRDSVHIKTQLSI